MNSIGKLCSDPAILKYSVVKGLTYMNPGNPLQTLNLTEWKECFLSAENDKDKVLVKFLAAPINPSDINQIAGTYPLKYNGSPAIAGNEGVGVVVAISSSSGCNQSERKSKLLPGDWVIPGKAALGTWRECGIFPDDSTFIRIPNDIPVEMAACLTVNLPTAYRLIRDYYGALESSNKTPIVQNGATSIVGQCVIQLCREWGIPTINIVRNRENIDATKDYLFKIGANEVFTEEELQKHDSIRDVMTMKYGALPSLGFNTISGSAAVTIAKILKNSGTLVTYGGMSGRPLTIPTSLFIFNDLRFVGFWMSKWYTKFECSSMERTNMLNELVELIRRNKLAFRTKTHSLQDYKNAVKLAIEGSENAVVREKQMFYFDK